MVMSTLNIIVGSRISSTSPACILLRIALRVRAQRWTAVWSAPESRHPIFDCQKCGDLLMLGDLVPGYDVSGHTSRRKCNGAAQSAKGNTNPPELGGNDGRRSSPNFRHRAGAQTVIGPGSLTNTARLTAMSLPLSTEKNEAA